MSEQRSSREVQADVDAVSHEIKAANQREQHLIWQRTRSRGWGLVGIMGRRVALDVGRRRLEKQRDALRSELQDARMAESIRAKEAEAEKQRQRRDEERERQRLGCPPNRSLDEHRQFLEAKKRVGDEQGLGLGNVRTWEELHAWERWGKDTNERSLRLQEAQRRGGLEEREREWDRHRREYGIVSKKDYWAEKEQERRRKDLAGLREDLHYVGWAGRDPDRIYDAAELKDNKPLRAWMRRRPELENELDTLAAQAGRNSRQLDPEEEEMVGALKELREAEVRAREERREEEERRLEGPDDGLSL